MEKKQKKENLKFETALKELELIASKLERGELDLDESIGEFEKGMQYAKFCHDKLEEAERRIEILQKGENSSVEKKAVRIKNETGEIEEDEELQGSLL
ncbi:MAG: exodeoxyribonuclease VII small subunit [Spirochaetae bacterium HGW-Spirochaetae-1]|nr:MAG: exodeoxyribonuclease VII small subunit [Spirochaetae bacterium HGW-Spirochaetae-1]